MVTYFGPSDNQRYLGKVTGMNGRKVAIQRYRQNSDGTVVPRNTTYDVDFSHVFPGEFNLTPTGRIPSTVRQDAQQNNWMFV